MVRKLIDFSGDVVPYSVGEFISVTFDRDDYPTWLKLFDTVSLLALDRQDWDDVTVVGLFVNSNGTIDARFAYD